MQRISYRSNGVRRGLDPPEASDLGYWLQDRAPALAERISAAAVDPEWDDVLVFGAEELDAIGAELQRHDLARHPSLRVLARLIEGRDLT